MRSLLRLELLKIIKWPLTWVLLVVLIGGIGIGTLVELVNLPQVAPDVHATLVQNLTLPGTITATLKLVYIFAAVLISILAAAAIGNEYGWGTLRPMLATGVPRGRFLVAKLLALALVAVVFVLLPVIVNAILAVPFAVLLGRPLMSGTLDAAWAAALLAMVARVVLIVLVSLTLALMFGVVGRSPVIGIGAALGLTIADQVMQLLLESLRLPWARTLDNLLLGQLSHVLMLHNSFGGSVAVPGAYSQERIVLILTLYGIASLAVALAVFRARDVRGAG